MVCNNVQSLHHVPIQQQQLMVYFQLLEIIQAFINIANADDFIHEKEVILIQHAINIWELDARVNKPKSGKKLELKN